MIMNEIVEYAKGRINVITKENQGNPDVAKGIQNIGRVEELILLINYIEEECNSGTRGNHQ